MFLKVARSIARPQTFAIMDLLKRSVGLSVNEIAKALKLSYMGVKQYCNELEKKGLVDTWRRPKEIGRPELSYRLTAKAASFYPEVGNELTLDILASIQQLYGSNAPDKLLFSYFAKKTDSYLKKLKGGTFQEKLASFAKLRDQDGCCAQVEGDETTGLSLVEFHNPMKEIATAFPNVARMEEMMFSRILGVSVQRTEKKISGLAKIVFQVTGATMESPASESEVEEVIEKEEIHEEVVAEEFIETAQEAEEIVPMLEVSEPEEIDSEIAEKDADEEIPSVYNMLAPPIVHAVEEVKPPQLENAPVVESDVEEVSKMITPSFAPAPEAEQDEFRLVG